MKTDFLLCEQILNNESRFEMMRKGLNEWEQVWNNENRIEMMNKGLKEWEQVWNDEIWSLN